MQKIIVAVSLFVSSLSFADSHWECKTDPAPDRGYRLIFNTQFTQGEVYKMTIAGEHSFKTLTCVDQLIHPDAVQEGCSSNRFGESWANRGYSARVVFAIESDSALATLHYEGLEGTEFVAALACKKVN
jgi:hypothetical protein